MAEQQFRLPDLGEGLTEAEILQWLVQVGDVIVLNQPIVEVETAKAAVEVPSPYAGTVTALLCQAGQTVEVGVPIITVQSGAADTVDPGAPAERQSVLVGYGPRPDSAVRRPRIAARPTSNGSGQVSPVVAPAGGSEPAPVIPPPPVVPPAAPQPAAAARALATPPVRMLARTLGVELSAIHGTGPAGVITRADVQAAQADTVAPATALAEIRPAGEQRIPIRGVRKATAAAMVASAFTAPQASAHVQVDVTEMMAARRRLEQLADFAGMTVSPLLLVSRAVLLAVRRRPIVNARWDEPAQEIVIPEQTNLGIATATERGLMVPNIKDAGRLSLPELARSLGAVVAAAREGHASVPDLQGGTITISNVGVFGVDGGTPILNPGEAAILCVGAVRERPWVHQGVIAVRHVVELTVSFDHRIIDGLEASEFLADIAALLADPLLMLARS
jgi:2-oxoisovalerate dehydrogenase E2 component (dihydrolipoyl transacylase)